MGFNESFPKSVIDQSFLELGKDQRAYVPSVPGINGNFLDSVQWIKLDKALRNDCHLVNV